MSLHWTPVGPEPASTYWRRRAAVAVVLLLVVVALANLFGGGDDGEDTATVTDRPSPRPAASATPSVDPSADPSAEPDPSASVDPSASPDPSASASSGTCTTQVLEVEPAADAESYAVGAQPRLSLSVTNTGTTPCTADLGQAQVELTISSGSDAIWSSDHCAPGGEPDVVTLQPGEPVVQRVTWDGRRSAPNCGGDKAAAAAGTYQVGGRLGQQRIQGSRFVLKG